MENNSIYSYKIRQVPCTLDNIRTIQSQEISILNSYEKDMLFDNLERGTDVISHELQMCMYMYSYGKMHKAKMFEVLANVEDRIFDYKDIAIVDWGCGQGIGTLAILEYMKQKGHDINNIKSVVLIDPSSLCINRAELHISLAHPECEITTINKKIEDIFVDEIKCQHYYVIHIFSNLLDVETVDIQYITKLIKYNRYLFAEYICVGPYFGGSERQNRYDDFGLSLGLTPHYNVSLEKGEWKNNWSFSARLYSHNTLRGLKQYNRDNILTLDTIEDAYAKTSIFDNEGGWWCWYNSHVLNGTKYIEHLNNSIILTGDINGYIYKTQKQLGEEMDLLNIRFYLESNDIKKTKIIDELMDCYRIAASEGTYEAYNNLGVYVLYMNEDFETNEKIRDKAIEYFKIAAEYGSELAIKNLLWMYANFYTAKETQQLLTLFKNRGSIEALYLNALAYQFGKLDYEQNYDCAKALYENILSLYEKNAEKYNIDGEYTDFIENSKYNLAQIYYRQHNYESAYTLIKDHKHRHQYHFEYTNFQAILSAILFDKEIVPSLVYITQQRMYYRCAIDCNIGKCYQYGIGVKKDLNLAETYFQRGYENGLGKDICGEYEYPSSIKLLASIKYDIGKTDEAKKLWNKAIELFPDDECALKLNASFCNDNEYSENVHLYMHNGCTHCHEAEKYNEIVRTCPRCEYEMGKENIMNNKIEEGVNLLFHSAVQGYSFAQKYLICEKTIYEHFSNIDEQKQKEWIVNTCKKGLLDTQYAAIDYYYKKKNIYDSLFWGAIAAHNSDLDYNTLIIVKKILRLYATGFYPYNGYDVYYWTKIVSIKENTTINKVWGDTLSVVGRKTAAEHFYSLDKNS